MDLKPEIRLMLEDCVESMDLKDKDKNKFFPIWNRHKKIFIEAINDFGNRQFDRGKDQHIDILNT